MAATKTAIWNGVSSASIPELVIGPIRRSILGSLRGVHTMIPGRPGSWYTAQPRGLRTVTMECHIMAEDAAARRAAVVAVSDWLDVEQEAKLYLSDMPEKFYWATYDEPSEPEEWREAATFELVWKVQPFAQDDNVTTESWVSDASDNHIWNPGLVAPSYPVITITPTNGTLTGFTLECNGDTLIFAGNIADDASVTINSIVPVVLTGINDDIDLLGFFDPADVLLVGVTGTFPVLMPGSNNVNFVKTGGTATSFDIDVMYRLSYRD